MHVGRDIIIAAIARRRICFTPDTLVGTPDGLKRIGDLRAGDLVDAFDFECGTWLPKTVEEKIESTLDGILVTIEVGDESIEVTGGHPFWVEHGNQLADRSTPSKLSAGEDESKTLSGRWVRADELQPGDVLVRNAEDRATISGVSHATVINQPVCNLIVTDLHNYSVSNLHILVHNGCDDAPRAATVGKAVSTSYRKTFFDAYPHLKGKVVVHHGVEQQVLDLYPGRFTPAEIHSLENLRGIPKFINPDVHLSKIRKEWNKFYRNNPNATREQILDEATRIDTLFGSQFDPPF